MSVPSRVHGLRALVRENLPYKVASLAIALWLFMVFRGVGAVQRSVDVPITAALPAATPGSPLLVTPLPERVRLTVRGTPSAVAPLRGDELGPIEVDLRDGRPRRVDLRSSLVRLPAGVEFVGFSPSGLDLRWDVHQSRTLPVRASVVGSPAPRTRVGAVAVEPAMVRARGPAQALEVLEAAHTTAVDASGLAPGHYERRVALEPPRDGVDFGTAHVRVTFDVSPLQGERRFERVPLTVRGAPRGAQHLEARPPLVAVVVSGDPELLAELTPEQVVPTVAAPDDAPLRAAAEVRVQVLPLREGLTSRVEPAEVLLVPTRAP